ncbi:MAG: histidine ammonia-lyase [Halobacteriales archaeon]
MAEPTVVVDGRTLTPEAVEAVARRDAPVELAPAAREAIGLARERVEAVLDSGEAVYGVTTGFGRLVDERIDRDDRRQLQVNLLRSHAAGVDDPLEAEVVRAMLLTRANALATGFSGVRPVVVEHLLELLNADVTPVVPRRGSLGASGDLAPLAHLGLVLIGEGEADVDGERLDGEAALAAAGLEPLEFRAKEGLAIINGTQLTLALASLLVVDARRLLDAADAAGALTTEVTMSTTATSDPGIAAARGHPGQVAAAENVRRLTADSAVVEAHGECDRVQDAYAIRCLTQVHGAVRTALAHLREAVEVELNAATDNPLVFEADAVDERAPGTAEAAVLSGGNFHGEPLALPLGYLQGALAELGTIAERRVDHLLNPTIQESHLPPFLAGEPGLESGLMLSQYTAAALGTVGRTRGRPALDNVTVSGNQEDHVSMSAEAALVARETLEAVRLAVAVELLCGAEATSYLPDDLGVGRGTAAVVDAVRAVVPPRSGDRPVGPDVERVAGLIADATVEAAIEGALGGPLSNQRAPVPPGAYR